MPTTQEELIMRLGHYAYETAIPHIIMGLKKGCSPSALSVARPDVLIGFAEAWRVNEYQDSDEVWERTYKTDHFDKLVRIAAEGDPAAIESLPKFVTSLGQLALVASLVLDHQDALKAWHRDRVYIQYLGTFDPQHIGHRIAVRSVLTTVGEGASAIIHVMDKHPSKVNLSNSYGDRYRESEERFYESPLLDNMKVTQVDIPGGRGLAREYPLQMALLASFSGDVKHRWLTGSDKLLFDVNTIKQHGVETKAAARFSDPKMHAYVVFRQSDNRVELENGIDYVSERFGTPITLIDELTYDCAPASSSRIKKLRADGKEDEANHMELYELCK